MKFTIFALAACLLCVNAVVVPSPNVDSAPEWVDLTDGQVAPEAFGVVGFTWKIVKVTLRSMKGFSCVISWVDGIKGSIDTFNKNILLCGVTASQDVTNLVNANVQIYSTAESIINLSTGVCAETEGEDPKITNSCFIKTLNGLKKLKKEVDAAIELAGKLPQTGPNASVCVNDAANTLTTYYTAMPENMVACSELTS